MLPKRKRSGGGYAQTFSNSKRSSESQPDTNTTSSNDNMPKREADEGPYFANKRFRASAPEFKPAQPADEGPYFAKKRFNATAPEFKPAQPADEGPYYANKKFRASAPEPKPTKPAASNLDDYPIPPPPPSPGPEFYRQQSRFQRKRVQDWKDMVDNINSSKMDLNTSFLATVTKNFSLYGPTSQYYFDIGVYNDQRDALAQKMYEDEVEYLRRMQNCDLEAKQRAKDDEHMALYATARDRLVAERNVGITEKEKKTLWDIFVSSDYHVRTFVHLRGIVRTEFILDCLEDKRLRDLEEARERRRERDREAARERERERRRAREEEIRQEMLEEERQERIRERAREQRRQEQARREAREEEIRKEEAQERMRERYRQWKAKQAESARSKARRPSPKSKSKSKPSSTSTLAPESETNPQIAAITRIRSQRPTSFYRILGLDKMQYDSITQTEIKKAFRKLSLLVHPDKNKHDGAEEAFKMINRAYETLGDEEKKRSFDKYGVTK